MQIAEVVDGNCRRGMGIVPINAWPWTGIGAELEDGKVNVPIKLTAELPFITLRSTTSALVISLGPMKLFGY